MPSRAPGTRGPLGEVLRLPTMRRLALACFGFISAEFGVWVAMLVYAYDRGSSQDSAIVAVVQPIPAIAVAPLAVAIIERQDSVRVLHFGCVALAAALAVTALALANDAPALVVYTAAMLATCTMTVTRPAQAAITPDGHPDRDLGPDPGNRAAPSNVGLVLTDPPITRRR